MERSKGRVLIQLLVLSVVIILFGSPTQVLAVDERPENPYFQVRTITLDDGTNLGEAIINGPPESPPGFEPRKAAYNPINLPAGVNIIPNVPAFNWSYGCSATSAAMIAGYYDRNGFPNMYSGPTNWSIMPLNNSVWPVSVDGAGDTRNQCPLSATHDGLDGRTSRGHVDDYWVAYLSEDEDPFVAFGSEHTQGDCTGDYMKTNQTTNHNNSDGSTTFYFYPNGNRLYCSSLSGYADGTIGLSQFYDSRGYQVDSNSCYFQATDNFGTSGGFSFDDFMAEIDAGYPVMVHVEGHTMVGVGYDSNTNEIYIHDTWNYDTWKMDWGGTYHDMGMWGVSIVHLLPWEHNSARTGNWHTNGSEGTWDLGSVPTIGDDVTIRSGHTVTVDGNAQTRNLTIQYGGTLIIPAGVTLTIEENLYNNGMIQQIKDVPLGGNATEFLTIKNDEGNQVIYRGVDITPETESMGLTMVELRGNHTNGCTTEAEDALVNRCINISPGVEASATIRFWFTEDERNGQESNNLSIWHYEGGWTSVGSNIVHSEERASCENGTPSGFGCYVEAQGILSYSPFGIGGGSAPTALTMEKFAVEEGKAFNVVVLSGIVILIMGFGLLLYQRRAS